MTHYENTVYQCTFREELVNKSISQRINESSLTITDGCVESELDLNSAGGLISRNRMGQSCYIGYV